MAHHLVDLNTPFWIEIKVNGETVSVLLTRWIEGGVHLSVMSQAYSNFFPFSFVYLIFLLSSPVSVFRSWLMREDNAFPFEADVEVKIIDIFTCVYSRQNFSSGVR